MYDRIPVGKALVLTKLEKAILYRRTFTEESFKEVVYWDQLKKFDDALDKIVSDWRRALHDEGGITLRARDSIDKIVHETVAKIEKAMEIWEGKNAKCGKNMRKAINPYEDDPQWGDGYRQEVEAVEEELRAEGLITQPSQKRATRRSTVNIE